MSSNRPTTLERAYELARSGACRSVSDIKQQLSAEGYDRLQDALYGRTLTSDLRKLCQQHYVDPDAGVTPDESATPE